MKLSWKLCPERVCDGYSFNLQSMLQVFAVEGFTARIERGGNDQAVIEAEAVAGLQFEAALIERPGRVDPPKRYQGVVQDLSGFLRRCIEFLDYDVKRLLDNLITDTTGFIFQNLLDQTLCSLAFIVIGFIKQVNEDIGRFGVCKSLIFRCPIFECFPKNRTLRQNPRPGQIVAKSLLCATPPPDRKQN